MASPTVIDHVELAIARLTQQYKDGATMPALLRVLLGGFAELEQAIQDVRACRAIQNAQGAQLDVLGRIVGQKREGRSDEVYRIWIRARIRLNLGSGTGEDIIAVLRAITQGTVAIVFEEQYPAGFVVRLGQGSIIPPADLAAIVRLAKAAGVQANVESTITDDPNAFAFSPNGAGFGTCSAATDTTGALAIGATVLPVGSSAGFAATDAIVVEPGLYEEARVVQSVGTGTITVSVALARAHPAAIEVRKSAGTGGRIARGF